MCHACVTESVKERMLSRRGLFRAGAAVAAAAALPMPALAQGARTVVDMTHALAADFPTFFGDQQFFETQVFNWAEHKFNLKEIRVNEHTGTHMDAPLHFSENGASVDAIPPARLVCPLCVVDIRAKAAENPDAQVTPDDLAAWVAAHGPVPEGACVAMNAGWAAHLRDARFRGADGEGKLHFPGFHVEAAQMLIEADAAGIAVDTLSLDHGPSGDFATHYAWLPTNRWGIENIAGLDDVPAAGATIVVGAPKHAGGTGGPARILTLV
jgi:kynurenine formamidase